MKKTLITLTALLGLSAPVMAQDPAPVTQVGNFALDPAANIVLAAALGFITNPLVAHIKKMKNTQGVTTQMVNAGISVAITAAVGYGRGAYGTGWEGVGQMLMSAVASFVVASGFYTMNKQAAGRQQ